MLIDSLISSQVYEIIKTIYDTTSDAAPNPISSESVDDTPRIKVLQSTLGQLRLNNIATLDAMTTHFTRLIDLTSADDDYVQSLAQTLAPCVLRPRLVNTLTMEERHPVRLVRDLFEHKESIFGELKRQASAASGAPSQAARQRAVSSVDEGGSRRAAMEARAKAINSERQRAKSPAPTNRHRRDKSTDGHTPGRFPVVASPRPDGSNGGRMMSISNKRGSLEVPGSATSSPVTNRHQQTDSNSSLNNGSSAPRTDASGPDFGNQALSPEDYTNPAAQNGTSSIYASVTQSTPDQQQSSSSPNEAINEIPAFEGIPDGEMPGAFGSTITPPSLATHIPPPAEDDETATPSSATEQKSGLSGLKRSAGTTGSGRRQPPTGKYGPLKTRSDIRLGGVQQQAPPGVQLQDRGMDDDFS